MKIRSGLNKNWRKLSFNERFALSLISLPISSFIIALLIGTLFNSSSIGLAVFIITWVWLSAFYYAFFDKIFEGVIDKNHIQYVEVDTYNRWKYAVTPTIITMIILVFGLFSLLG